MGLIGIAFLTFTAGLFVATLVDALRRPIGRAFGDLG